MIREDGKEKNIRDDLGRKRIKAPSWSNTIGSTLPQKTKKELS